MPAASSPCTRPKARVLGAFVVLTTALAAAPLTYVESVDGDLGPSASNPKILDFDVGVNRISGTMGKPPSLPPDADYFRFTLEPGEYLTSINVITLSFSGNFFAVQTGPTISTSDGAAHLFNTLVTGLGELTDNPRYEPSSGTADGFPDPLGAGTYTVWYQELGGLVNYTFDYTVTAIPEPSAFAALAGLAGLGLAASRRRRA
jgi:hypothetical protein